jgi:hypothetical protein
MVVSENPGTADTAAAIVTYGLVADPQELVQVLSGDT